MNVRPATLLFAALILAGFLHQLYIAKICCTDNPRELLSAVAMKPILIESGAAFSSLDLRTDWWRLGASMFVHAGVIHLLACLISLLQIGYLLESLFGSAIAASSFLISGILAAIATLLIATGSAGVIYVGSSGAIFGMAGTLLAGAWRIWRAERSRWSRRLSTRLIGCVIVNLILGIAASAAAAWAGLGFTIANTAHVAGLATGLLLGTFPFRMRENERTAQIIRWFDPPPPSDEEA